MLLSSRDGRRGLTRVFGTQGRLRRAPFYCQTESNDKIKIFKTNLLFFSFAFFACDLPLDCGDGVSGALVVILILSVILEAGFRDCAWTGVGMDGFGPFFG